MSRLTAQLCTSPLWTRLSANTRRIPPFGVEGFSWFYGWCKPARPRKKHSIGKSGHCGGVPRGCGPERPQRSGSSRARQRNQENDSGRARAHEPPRNGCLFCHGSHWLKDCMNATESKKEEARQKFAGERDQRRGDRLKHLNDGANINIHTVIGDAIEVPLCFDTGSDHNVVPRRILEQVQELDVEVRMRQLDLPLAVTTVGGVEMICAETACLAVSARTAAGPLMLRALECLVLNADEPEFLLGHRTMQSLGIDVGRQMERLAVGNLVAEQDADGDLTTEPVIDFNQEGNQVRENLERMLDGAAREANDVAWAAELRALVMRFEDVSRISVGPDLPANVGPLRVELVENARPYRAGTRRCSPDQRQFLHDHVRELEQHGLVRRNNQSRWASPALPVRKPGTDQFHITVDYRAVNKMTVPIAGATPNLATVMNKVEGAVDFGQFGFFNGFWQLPLHESSQERFRFVTEDGVFTPTRVLQGACDSALHFQLQMHARFQEMLLHGAHLD